MARKKVECITCDRCNRLVEEILEEESIVEEDDTDGTEELRAEDASDRADDVEVPILVLESKHGDITFEDLCDKCDKRVADLITQMQIPPKPEKKSKKNGKDKKDDNKKATATAGKKDAKKDAKKNGKPSRSTKPSGSDDIFA